MEHVEDRDEDFTDQTFRARLVGYTAEEGHPALVFFFLGRRDERIAIRIEELELSDSIFIDEELQIRFPRGKNKAVVRIMRRAS